MEDIGGVKFFESTKTNRRRWEGGAEADRSENMHAVVATMHADADLQHGIIVSILFQ